MCVTIAPPIYADSSNTPSECVFGIKNRSALTNSPIPIIVSSSVRFHFWTGIITSGGRRNLKTALIMKSKVMSVDNTQAVIRRALLWAMFAPSSAETLSPAEVEFCFGLNPVDQQRYSDRHTARTG